MLRVHHEVVNQVYGPYRTGNLFAGSVLFLEPATIYEIRFIMSDPDGGAPTKPKIVSATTRAEPRAFKGEHTIKGSADKGFLAAFKEAKPGDVILLAPGVYKGPFDLEKSGTAKRPIVIRGPAEGEAILEGDGIGSKSRIVTLNGTHHLNFERLTFRGAQTAIYAAKPNGSVGLVVHGCRIYDVVYGINTGCANSKPTAYSTMDYNAYRRNESDRFISWKNNEGKVGRYRSIKKFFKATGLEEHGIMADYDVFVGAGPPEKGKTYDPSDYDLRLRISAKVVDAGIALPQITDGLTGRAPDLGCYELGQEPPRYGPRLSR